MQAIINQADTTDPWTRWGLAQAPAAVIDPKTRLPYSPTPADWVAALNKVPVLLNRSGLTLQQLYQLLEVVWVTHVRRHLAAGHDNGGGRADPELRHGRHDLHRAERRRARPREPFPAPVGGDGPADVGAGLGAGPGGRAGRSTTASSSSWPAPWRCAAN